jgi:flagellar assembly protein FliH
MNAPRRFLFDTEFGAPKPVVPTVPMITVAEHEATLATAVADAHRRGVAEGKTSADAEAQKRVAFALQRAGDAIAALSAGLDDLERRLEQEAIDVALAVAGRLCPTLIAREPMAELESLARDCFTHLRGVSHVVVRVDDGLFDRARAELEQIARERGFDGRLVILAEPDLRQGDIRVEWADGGVTRERSAVEADIDTLIGRYLSSRQALPAGTASR